jgi:WS/DGAT/MGAT family acyltransferase
VRRLSGADSIFVFSETPTCHQHTLKIAIVDPTGADVPVDAAGLRDQIREAAALLEPLRWRLVRVPFDLGHPWWTETAELDLDYHVQHASVAPPGDDAALAACVSQIASVGLDRDRPLWQVWFIDGLATGDVAYLAKVHHALADGVSSGELLADVFADTPDATTLAVATPCNEEVPSRTNLFGRALFEVAGMLIRLPALLIHTARAALRMRAHGRRAGVRHAPAFSGPHTVFDAPLTPNRTLAYAAFQLSDLKQIGSAFGATVTEVMTTMASGALRRYLDARGSLPETSLSATIPVSVRSESEHRVWGNRVATLFVSLATDVADPVERLAAVRVGTRAARAELDAVDPRLQHAWSEYWRIFRLVTLGMPRLVRSFLHKPSYNVIISSVRGPDTPRYRHGARLARIISMGPLVEGIGVNFTGWSYAGEFVIAVMACPESVPDIWSLAAGLRAEFDALNQVATPTQVPLPR